MSQGKIVLLSLALGIAVYTPVGMYFFDVPLSSMFERAYFSITGAAIALYAMR